MIGRFLVCPFREILWVAKKDIGQTALPLGTALIFQIMANTYTQMHIQAVFAVQNRISLIQPTWKDEVYKYISTIISIYEHKLLQINGMPLICSWVLDRPNFSQI